MDVKAALDCQRDEVLVVREFLADLGDVALILRNGLFLLVTLCL